MTTISKQYWIDGLENTYIQWGDGYLFYEVVQVYKGVFAYGYGGYFNNTFSNYITDTGVVGAATTLAGTTRTGLAACGYGLDKGIFGYGRDVNFNKNMTNLVSNTGVIASDTTGVGTARAGLAALTYGLDKGIFAYGG